MTSRDEVRAGALAEPHAAVGAALVLLIPRRKIGLIAPCLGLGVAVALAGAGLAQEPPRDQLVARMTAWTRLPKRAIVAVKPDVMVAILKPGVRDRSGDVEGIVLQSEAADEEAAQAAGWRSMRSEIDVSCATRSNRFHHVALYSGHNLTGAPRAHTPPAGWIHPTAKAYMFEVIEAVCGPERQPLAPPVTVAQGAPPMQTAQVAPPPRRASPLVSADLPEADAPMPATRQVAAAAPARTPAALAPKPTAPRPAEALPVAAPRRSGVGVVQIAAFPTAAESEQALSAFAQTPAGQTPGLSRRIETARVKGVLYYRAIIAGFGSTAEASAMCATIKRSGGDCFVRP